ncbi:MAG TPA: PAS domain-containing protein, partial [Flavisolibacter sp.]|nr:PAS domain-containing protein [Flavisolibacter sp.]
MLFTEGRKRLTDMTRSSNLIFQLLPGFAAFLLKKRLRAFVEVQLEIARELDLPMLRTTLQLNDEQIIEQGLTGARIFLEHLSENNYSQFILISNEVWRKDELKFAGKYDVVADDITQGVFVRNKALKRFIPAYLKDIEQAFALADEIDNMTLADLTIGTNTLLDLLKDRIERETHFAGRLISATPGIIFVYNFKDRKINYLNQNIKDLLGRTMQTFEQITPETLPLYVHPEDLPYLLMHFQDVFSSEENKTFKHEYRLKHADGSYRWIRNYEVIFNRDQQGRPLEILGESFDITREKEVVLAL